MGSGSGYGMGSGMGGGYGYGMGSGYGMNMGYGGMGMDMDDMEWPRRCRSRCAYTKRDSFDNRMFCFARSDYSQSMCIADDYDGEKPINVSEWEGYGSGSGSGMGSAILEITLKLNEKEEKVALELNSVQDAETAES